MSGSLTQFPKKLPKTADLRDAITWVKSVIRLVGLGFHPDTRFVDYVRVRDGSRSFEYAECRRLQHEFNRARTILQSADVDIYSLSLPQMRRILRQQKQ